MAKSVDLNSIDALLNDIKTNGNKLHLLNADPGTTFSNIASFTLGNVTVASGDFTLANGTTNGRKVTIAGKTGIAVTAAGTGTHVAVVDTVNSRIKLVTTCTSQAVSNGGTFDIASWAYEVNLPT